MLGFGPHLTLDLNNANYDKLIGLDYIREYLNILPDKINMTKIMEPYVMVYDSPNKPEDFGISGFVIIAESHISIHTFPAKHYAFIDIFSCKDFDINEAINFTKKYFDTENIEIQYFSRGTEFPRDLNIAKNLIDKERKRFT